MFVGHYGPAYAAKAAKTVIPLWIAFIAVQLIDVIWSIFVLLGIEKARMVPGITASNALDLYYMPYTHSLVGALFWSGAAVVVYRLTRRSDGWPAALIIGVAVFSHWILDLLVHRPDLPLYDDTHKVGLGLWNYPLPSLLLELSLLFGGIYLYVRSTRAISSFGRYGVLLLGIFMALIHYVAFFTAPPVSVKTFAALALVGYIVFGANSYLVERSRTPRPVATADP